jgi:nucleoid-associated protein YgaU
MKIRNMFVIFTVLLALVAMPNFAQEEEMTEEQWQEQMSNLQAQKESLQQQADQLRQQIDQLNTQLSSMQTYEECIDELYALVGATKDDIDKFRMAVNDLESKIRRKEGPKKDRVADLEALQMNKISALPEFYKKVHMELPDLLDQWVEKPDIVMHTVVKGDCLWCIARENRYYGNGFAWPKIYDANRDKIKDPDLIYPGQEFKIPPLTPAEKEKYDKLKRNYKPAPVN